MKLAIILNREELATLHTPIVVEMWDHRLFGRVKRAWLKEFDERERRKAKRWYNHFYQWHLIKGIPDDYVFRSIEDIEFVKRLVNFFAMV